MRRYLFAFTLVLIAGCHEPCPTDAACIDQFMEELDGVQDRLDQHEARLCRLYISTGVLPDECRAYRFTRETD